MKPQDNKQQQAEDCPTCHIEIEQKRRDAAAKAKQQQHDCPSGNCR